MNTMKRCLKDEFNILNNKGEREITLKKMCNIMGIEVPEKFRHIENIVNNNVVTSMEDITEGCIYFKLVNINVQGNLSKRVDTFIKKGASVIFSDEIPYYEEGFDRKDYPIIPIKDLTEKCGAFLSYIKELNDVKTIAVTGTCGKTTTMKFLGSIVPLKYKTYTNKGNLNSYNSVARHIMNELTPDKEIYIQETGASGKESIRKAAAMLKADAFIILNVFGHHINEYKTPENIFFDKISHDDYLKTGGVVIANYDDDRIANHNFKHNIISFGINTEKKVDYRAENIVQNGEILEMDIIYEGKDIHVETAILGIQNAYNVLAAFALSRWLNIDEKSILKGFEKYESKGIRQNFRKVGEYNLLIDCYNVCEDSLRADINTLRKYELSDKNKRIAVISGENKLGENAKEVSFEMGRSLNLEGIDKVICVGIKNETLENINFYAHSRAVYEGIISTGYKNIEYVSDSKEFEIKLKEAVQPGDLILFKGMYNLDFSPVIDNTFGTAISMNNPYYIKQSKLFKEKGFTARKIKIVDGVDIIKVDKSIKENIIIPDQIKGNPVHRVGEGLFKFRRDIKKVNLGNSVKNIGKSAFAGCIKLKSITIPSSVRVIERGAFKGCIGLKEVHIGKGVIHIDKEAFCGCINLRKVYIPNSVKYIDEAAFKYCCLVKLITEKNI